MRQEKREKEKRQKEKQRKYNLNSMRIARTRSFIKIEEIVITAYAQNRGGKISGYISESNTELIIKLIGYTGIVFGTLGMLIFITLILTKS